MIGVPPSRPLDDDLITGIGLSDFHRVRRVVLRSLLAFGRGHVRSIIEDPSIGIDLPPADRLDQSRWINSTESRKAY